MAPYPLPQSPTPNPLRGENFWPGKAEPLAPPYPANLFTLMWVGRRVWGEIVRGPQAPGLPPTITSSSPLTPSQYCGDAGDNFRGVQGFQVVVLAPQVAAQFRQAAQVQAGGELFRVQDQGVDAQGF